MSKSKKYRSWLSKIGTWVSALSLILLFLICSASIYFCYIWFRPPSFDRFCNQDSPIYKAIKANGEFWASYFPKDEASATFAHRYLTFKAIEGDMYIVYPEYWTTADQSPIFYIPLEEKLNAHRHVGFYGFFYTPNHKMPSEGVGQIRKLDDEIYCYITQSQ